MLPVDRAPFGVVEEQIEDRVQVGLRRSQLDRRGRARSQASSSRRHGRCRTAVSRLQPASAPGTAQEPGPTRKTCDDEPSKSMSIDSMGLPGSLQPLPGQRDEEVEQAIGSVLGPVDEQEPASRRPRQRARRPRGKRRGEARVNSVAALGKDLGSGLGGEPVARGDRSSHHTRA